jgi:hypothetical protein
MHGFLFPFTDNNIRHDNLHMIAASIISSNRSNTAMIYALLMIDEDQLMRNTPWKIVHRLIKYNSFLKECMNMRTELSQW